MRGYAGVMRTGGVGDRAPGASGGRPVAAPAAGSRRRAAGSNPFACTCARGSPAHSGAGRKWPQRMQVDADLRILEAWDSGLWNVVIKILQSEPGLRNGLAIHRTGRTWVREYSGPDYIRSTRSAKLNHRAELRYLPALTASRLVYLSFKADLRFGSSLSVFMKYSFQVDQTLDRILCWEQRPCLVLSLQNQPL